MFGPWSGQLTGVKDVKPEILLRSQQPPATPKMNDRGVRQRQIDQRINKPPSVRERVGMVQANSINAA